MKILLIHNFYGSEAPSGENQVFEAEKSLLERYGHEVTTFTRHSDEIRGQGFFGFLRGAVATPWNLFAARTVRKILANFHPDIVHAHNTFPLISPAIFHAVGSRAASVMTLHNYRLLCPAAIPMRSGVVCTDCIEQRSVMPALQHGCYRKSRIATVPLAANVALHRTMGTWQRQIDAFITLSNFQKELLVEGGLPADKLHVKPNFYPGNPSVLPFFARSGYVVCVGRLSDEKGLRTLLKAWVAWGASAPELRLVGDGPLRESLQRQAQGLPVRFLGQIPSAEAQEQIAAASLLILPSECFEGFPMVVREAFAFGTPVVASDLGPLPSIVQHGVNGMVFPAGRPDALLQVVKSTWQSPSRLAGLSLGARNSFEAMYTEQVNYQTLMHIYHEAINRNKQIRI